MGLQRQQARARGALRGYARASQLAVALVGILLLLWLGPTEDADVRGGSTVLAQGFAPSSGERQDDDAGDGQAAAAPVDPAEAQAEGRAEGRVDERSGEPNGNGPPEPAPSPGAAVQEATGTLREVLLQGYNLIPKLAIAIIIMLAGWGLSRLIRMLLLGVLANWDRAEAVGAMSMVVIFLMALGLALSVIAGDSRALVGSVGLAGLALSWALQAPIESFTGWLLNSFQSYYRVGDRISVGEVFGDVYRIDILTTMVWEAGGPNKPVQGAQPTGALITFPNSEVLRSNIVNYTRDFPHVWDEVTFSVANASDLAYTAGVMRRVAVRVLGQVMEGPAREYRKLVRRTKHLGLDIATEPQVYASVAESWTDLTVRYLVPARERRKWSSELVMTLSAELAAPEHAAKIIPGYPRSRIELLSPDHH